MTAKGARKQKPKVRPPADLPAPVTVRLKPNSYLSSKAEMEEPVKMDATPEKLARAALRPVNFIEKPDA